MKPSVRLCHVCKVFSTIGIASLFILTGVVAVLLSPPPVAHAWGRGHEVSNSCSNGWWEDPSGVCRPPGFCATGFYINGGDDGQVNCSDNSTRSCPAGYWGDPDSPRCIPDSQRCGSASYLSSDQSYCVVSDPEGYLQQNYP